MTTTHASHSAPKPVESAHKPSQTKARAEADKAAEAPVDLFATMMALFSEAHADPSADETTLADADAATGTADANTGAANPLAALLGWMVPAQAAAGTDAAARGAADKGASTGAVSGRDSADKVATAAEGSRNGAIDIEGMTRVDEAAPALPNAAAQARAAIASRPAFSPLNPNHAAANAVTTSARTADGQNANLSASTVVWQRGATSNTDALQQQQATQLAQVRSTVALNERFGLANAPLESGAAVQPQNEFTTTNGMGRGALSGPAVGNDGGTAGLVGAGSSGDAGNGNGEHATDTQTSDGQSHHHAEAGAEKDAATVSHWGTQHLRHASLRVGDGGADAIDIQLQVKGQEVQVAFQTDNAEARTQLRDNAGASLSELMERSGIQLGNVSVGSQGQPSGGDAQPRADAGARTTALGRAGAAADSAASRPLPQQPLRADGSRPLDVFA